MLYGYGHGYDECTDTHYLVVIRKRMSLNLGEHKAPAVYQSKYYLKFVLVMSPCSTTYYIEDRNSSNQRAVSFTFTIIFIYFSSPWVLIVFFYLLTDKGRHFERRKLKRHLRDATHSLFAAGEWV